MGNNQHSQLNLWLQSSSSSELGVVGDKSLRHCIKCCLDLFFCPLNLVLFCEHKQAWNTAGSSKLHLGSEVGFPRRTMLQTGEEWYMHEEGNDIQAKRLGNNKHETLFNLICKQTTSSQNSTKLNPFSPFTLAGSRAGKGGGKSIPSLPLSGWLQIY